MAGRLRSFGTSCARSRGCCISALPVVGGKENPEIAKRRVAERKTFTDDENHRRLLQVVFRRRNLHVAGRGRPHPQIRGANPRLYR